MTTFHSWAVPKLRNLQTFCDVEMQKDTSDPDLLNAMSGLWQRLINSPTTLELYVLDYIMDYWDREKGVFEKERYKADRPERTRKMFEEASKQEDFDAVKWEKISTYDPPVVVSERVYAYMGMLCDVYIKMH